MAPTYDPQVTRAPRLLVIATIDATLRAFLLPYADHFRRRGWRVDAMAHGVLGSAPTEAAFDRVWEVDWSRNPLAPRNLVTVPRIVRRVVEEQGYDLVHVHTPVASFVSRLALRPLRASGLRVVYTAHGFAFFRGGSRPHNLAYWALERTAAAWTDTLVVMNQEDLEAARGFGTIDRERVVYMPGIGVDTSVYRADEGGGQAALELRRGLGIAADAFMALMVAEFIPRKRHEDALRAFAAMGDERAHLLMAGTGPLLEPMRRLAAELGLGARTHFLGYRNDIPVLLQAADAMLLPSSQEGLPRSVMEAMSLGTPVLGSDIRGTRDLLAEGAGLLFSTGDVPAFAAALRRLADGGPAVAAIVEAARRRVERYDLRPLIERHERLYADLLHDPSLDQATLAPSGPQEVNP